MDLSEPISDAHLQKVFFQEHISTIWKNEICCVANLKTSRSFSRGPMCKIRIYHGGPTLAVQKAPFDPALSREGKPHPVWNWPHIESFNKKIRALWLPIFLNKC